MGADELLEVRHEPYSEELRAEIFPLLQQNWRESPSYKPGFDIDPDWSIWREFDRTGALLLLTGRDLQGTLCGYIIAVMAPSPIIRGMQVAHIEAFYVRDEFRGCGLDLYRQAEATMRRRGITRVGWHVSQLSDVQEVALGLGFVEDEVLMEKTLCASSPDS